MNWEPIDTAPKDTWIVVYCEWVNELAFGKYRTTPQERGPTRTGWQIRFNNGYNTYIEGAPTSWLDIDLPSDQPSRESVQKEEA